MKTKGIRLEADMEMYSFLRNVQNEVSEKTGKKVALSRIILDYLQKYKDNNGNEHQLSGNVQNDEHFNEQMDILLEKEEQLYNWENKLKKQKQELNREYEELNGQWEEINNEKDEFNQYLKDIIPNALKSTRQESEIEHHEQKLKDKTDTIIELRQQLRKAENETNRMLQKIEDNTKQNIIFDKILPVLSPVISLIGFILTNKNLGNKNVDLSSFVQDIEKVYKKLKKEDQEKLTKFVMKTIEGEDGKEDME